jgi:hypothetical protein
MKIGDKTYEPVATNVSAEKCPLCDKSLKYKPPCCTDRFPWLVCVCGYKRKP